MANASKAVIAESSPGSAENAAVPAEPHNEAQAVVRAAIPAAITFAFGILALLNIQGDALQRLIRNYPEQFVLALGIGFSAALISLAAGFSIVFTRKRSQESWVLVVEIVGSLFVVVSSIVILSLGAQSIALRDQPDVQFTAVQTDAGVVRLSANATAGSLQASEKLLLRIAVVTQDVPSEQVNLFCKDSDGSPSGPEGPWHVIYWTESAPNTAGVAEDEFEIDLNDDHVYFACASAFLILRDSESRAHFATSVIDISRFFVTESTAIEH